MRAAWLLLPQGHEIDRQRRDRRALHDLNEAKRGEIGQQPTEHERGRAHADQQHNVEKGDDPGAFLARRQVGREREPGRLNGVEAEANEREGETGRDRSHPFGAISAALQEQQRERHDRETAELDQRAEPHIGHAPPTEQRPVIVRAMPHQDANGRNEQRQRDDERDEGCRNAEFDNHHAVQRARQQHGRHADRHLEQGQPQKPRKRQIIGGGIRKRHPAGADRLPKVEHGRRAPAARSARRFVAGRHRHCELSPDEWSTAICEV